MANQYKSALHYAAEDLSKECAEHGIDFDFTKREIYWRGIVKKITPGTTKQECLQTLRKMIKSEQKLRVEETQGALI